MQRMVLLLALCGTFVDLADYGLLVRPSLEQWSVQQHDFVTVQKLDLNNLLVVSGILAQTVALDHFERKVMPKQVLV